MGVVAISREEASQLPEKTQLLPHDPENRYVVSFSVFHDLHCLVSSIYPETNSFVPPSIDPLLHLLDILLVVM